MDKSRKAKIVDAIAEINKKQGKGTVFTIGEGEFLDIKRVSTNIEQLDYVLGGGLPAGKQIQIAGMPSAGKTTLVHYLTSLFDIAMNFPVEGAFSSDRAKLFGNKQNQLFVQRTTTGEDCMNRVLRFAKMGAPIIAIDSVPWLQSKSEIEKRDKAAEKNTIEQARMSGTTAVINPYIPDIGATCQLTGTIMIWVNQVREKIGALPFGEQTYTPGGKMLHHAIDIDLRLSRRAWITIPNHDPRNSATQEKIGIIIKIKCVKNRVAPPERECELVYLYDRGFISHAELPATKKEIAAQRKEFFKKKSNYKDTEADWDEEEEWEDD